MAFCGEATRGQQERRLGRKSRGRVERKKGKCREHIAPWRGTAIGAGQREGGREKAI